MPPKAFMLGKRAAVQMEIEIDKESFFKNQEAAKAKQRESIVPTQANNRPVNNQKLVGNEPEVDLFPDSPKNNSKHYPLLQDQGNHEMNEDEDLFGGDDQ